MVSIVSLAVAAAGSRDPADQGNAGSKPRRNGPGSAAPGGVEACVTTPSGY
jgi:hypothetical protein